MRTLTDHIVSGDQAVQLKIEATDEPGAVVPVGASNFKRDAKSGANHRYEVTGFDSTANPSNFYDPSSAALIVLFQNGPIKEAGVNGITGEALIAIEIDRLRSFQAGPFACRENAIALTHFEEGLMWLQRRTAARIKRGVEGTNQK